MPAYETQLNRFTDGSIAEQARHLETASLHLFKHFDLSLLATHT